MGGVVKWSVRNYEDLAKTPPTKILLSPCEVPLIAISQDLHFKGWHDLHVYIDIFLR